MNIAIIEHLVGTELRRNAGLIGLFLIAVAISPIPEVIVIIGGLLAAKIGQDFNLIRTTAHWKTLPISGRDWAASLTCLFWLIFAIPVAIRQGAMVVSLGLSLPVAIHAAVEVGIVSLVMAAIMLAISTASASWKSLTRVIIAIAAVIEFISWSLSNGPTPTSLTDATGLARVGPWWTSVVLVPLTIVTISMLIGYNTKRPRTSILLLLVGVSLFIAVEHWAEQHTLYKDVRKAAGSFAVEAKEASHNTDQSLLNNLVISGLPAGGFVEINTAVSHPDLMPKIWNNAHIRSEAVNRIFPDNPYLMRSQSYWVFNEMKTPVPLATQEYFTKHGFKSLRINGEVFQWQEIGSAPFEVGNQLMKHDLAFEISKMETQAGNNGGFKFHFAMHTPLLRSSKMLTRNFHRNRWKGVGVVLLVACHEELDETVLLMRCVIYPKKSVFLRTETIQSEFLIEPDPR